MYERFKASNGKILTYDYSVNAWVLDDLVFWDCDGWPVDDRGFRLAGTMIAAERTN